MPLYAFYCPNCEVDEEIILPMQHRNITRFHLCGCEMKRLMTVPRLVLMKKSGKEMALDSLNSKDTAFMKPEMKTLAAAGLKEADNTFY